MLQIRFLRLFLAQIRSHIVRRGEKNIGRVVKIESRKFSKVIEIVAGSFLMNSPIRQQGASYSWQRFVWTIELITAQTYSIPIKLYKTGEDRLIRRIIS